MLPEIGKCIFTRNSVVWEQPHTFKRIILLSLFEGRLYLSPFVCFHFQLTQSWEKKVAHIVTMASFELNELGFVPLLQRLAEISEMASPGFTFH